MTSDEPPTIHSNPLTVINSPSVKLMPKETSLSGRPFGVPLGQPFIVTPPYQLLIYSYYLSYLLEGPTLLVIVGLKKTTTNYTEAVDTLERVY